MRTRIDGASLRRVQGQRHQRVTFMELFFDLVFVFAVTQLSHLLIDHLSLRGALQTLMLTLAVWWAWINTAWLTNWFDPDRRAVRLLLIGVMLGSLIMAAMLPEAFGERGLAFAGAYVAMQIGRGLFAIAALRDEPGLRRNFQRIFAWVSAAGVLWLAGGVAHDGTREALWLAAIAIECVAPAIGFYTPGLGRSETTDWTIAGGHLAERCELFLIIALGETILLTGATFSDLSVSAAGVGAFVVAFAGSVALWWVYFDRGADAGTEVIAASDDPGRLGRSAYTYFHLPMVAGIVVYAVGAELVVAHPTGHADTATILTVLGGPALFLAGHVLFKWAMFGRLSVARLVAIAALAGLLPLARVSPPLLGAGAATLIVALVAWWGMRMESATAPAAASTPVGERA